MTTCQFLVKVTQSCLTLCNPIESWNSPGQNTGVGILGESSEPRDQTQVSRVAGRFFTSWVTREAQQKKQKWIKSWAYLQQAFDHGQFCFISNSEINSRYLIIHSISNMTWHQFASLKDKNSQRKSYICVNIQYLFFSFWLTSLCMTDSKFIHITTNDPILFFLMAK